MKEAVCDGSTDTAKCSSAFCSVPLREAVLQRTVLEERDVGQQLKQCSISVPLCQWLELCISTTTFILCCGSF
jgi:hypothetical protein